MCFHVSQFLVLVCEECPVLEQRIGPSILHDLLLVLDKSKDLGEWSMKAPLEHLKTEVVEECVAVSVRKNEAMRYHLDPRAAEHLPSTYLWNIMSVFSIPLLRVRPLHVHRDSDFLFQIFLFLFQQIWNSVSTGQRNGHSVLPKTLYTWKN